MTQYLQPVFSVLIGLALAIYGTLHTITHYPGAAAFAVLWASLPSLGTIAIFGLGIAAVITGVLLLILGARATRRRWQRLRYAMQRPVERDPYDEDGDWHPACR
jgi:hypothetical protein